MRAARRLAGRDGDGFADRLSGRQKSSLSVRPAGSECQGMTAGTAALSGAAVAFRFCFQAQARRTGLTRRRQPNRQPNRQPSTMASRPVGPDPSRFTPAAVPTPGDAHASSRNGNAIALMSASARSYRFPNDLLQLGERQGSPGLSSLPGRSPAAWRLRSAQRSLRSGCRHQ